MNWKYEIKNAARLIISFLIAYFYSAQIIEYSIRTKMYAQSFLMFIGSIGFIYLVNTWFGWNPEEEKPTP